MIEAADAASIIANSPGLHVQTTTPTVGVASRVPARSLSAYVRVVDQRVERTMRAAALPGDQLDLLLSRAGARHGAPVLAHPLAPFYFAIRAHDVPVGEHAEALGAAFMTLFHALRVVDDVQDDDLSGPLAACGPALATNCGMTLFFLALDAMWQAASTLGGAGGQLVRRSLRVHALRLASGQHRDIASRGKPVTTAEALATSIDKSAIFALLFELAGVCSGAAHGNELPHEYRVIGDAMAEIHQLADDICDLSRAQGEDIRTDTRNVPLTLMLDLLPEAERVRWAERLPTADPREVRSLLHQTGAARRVVAIAGGARRRIHTAFAALPCDGPYLALMLAWLDEVAQVFCRPAAVTTAIDIDATSPAGLGDEDAALLCRLQAARRSAQ